MSTEKQQNNTSNFNQALWLFISQAGSYALVFVSAAIFSRYFDKSAYGTYKQVMYVYATLQTVFVVGLPGIFSYFIPRLSNAQGKTLVNKFTLILVFLGAVFSMVLYFGSTVIAQILKNPELETALKIFALVPLFTLPTLGVEGIYTALRKTKYIAFYQIISKTFNLLCVLAPVLLLGGSYKTALTGWTFAAFLIFLIALWMKRHPYVKIKSELIPNMYKMVFNYSTPLLGASIVGIFLHSANQFFISRYYGTVIFAEFSNGFIAIPFVSMIAGSVKGVLTPLFSKATFEGNIQEIFSTYKNAVLKVANILFPILFFCMFFAKDIMRFLWGSQYEVSAIYFQISIVKDICEVLPYIAILLAFGKSKIYFYLHITAALLIWVADFIIVTNQLHPVFIAAASSVLQVLIACAVYLYFNYALKLKLIQPIIKHLLIVTIHISTILIIITLLRSAYPHDLSGIVSLIVCGIVFYVLLIVSGNFIKINYLESLSIFLKARK